MQPANMQLTGFIVTIAGSMFIVLGGAYFYTYFANLAAASTSNPSTSSLSGIYNSTLGMPIIVTLTIFGLGMIIVGGFFIASAHISQQILDNQTGEDSPSQKGGRPSKVCLKCGSLLYNETPYCPNCGGPISKFPAQPQS